LKDQMCENIRARKGMGGAGQGLHLIFGKGIEWEPAGDCKQGKARGGHRGAV